MNRKKSNGIKQRQKIIQVATRLMSKKGYKGSSLQEIADKAGIHKSTSFHYFKNKEELLLAVLRVSIDRVTANLREILENQDLSPVEKLHHAIHNHLDLLVKYIDNVKVYHSEIRFLSKENRRKYIETRKNYASYFEQIIDQIKAGESGHFAGLDTKIVTFGILGMCNWVVHWYQNSGPLKTDEITDVFFRMLIPEAGSKEWTSKLQKSKKP
jgi:AcrR family transcriptional regulator